MPELMYKIMPNDTLWLLAKKHNTTVNAILEANPGIDLKSLRVGQIIRIISGHNLPDNNPIMGISRAELDLNNTIRSLWEQHVAWTRMTIISIVFNLPDVTLVTNRLLRNPADFEAALRPFYGNRASRFRILFEEHLRIADQLVRFSKAGNTNAASAAERRWYQNSDEIAAFLASINPNWSQQEWKTMLYRHLVLTKSEASNIITGNYTAGISVYDDIERQALMMADTMTRGIVKQFPERFGR